MLLALATSLPYGGTVAMLTRRLQYGEGEGGARSIRPVEWSHAGVGDRDRAAEGARGG